MKRRFAQGQSSSPAPVRCLVHRKSLTFWNGGVKTRLPMKQCDINKVGVMVELFKTPPEKRDTQWLESFYQNVVDASYACDDPQVSHGPDGFPYFTLRTPQPNAPFDSFCVCNLIDHTTEHGFGIAINPTDKSADWVFSGGDLLCYRLFGKFQMPIEPQEQWMPKPDEEVMIGQPDENVLPAATRAIFKRLLKSALNMDEPKMLAVFKKDSPTPRLLFSVFKEDCESEDVFNRVMRSISWLLPRHYILMHVPKDSELCQHLAPM